MVAFQYREVSPEQITDTLRARIMGLAVKPGTLISENELANEFLVSRTKVRAAIAQLRSEGFIVVVPQRGTFVNFIDRALIDDIVVLRATAETRVMSDLCSLITQNQLNKLKEMLDAQRQCLNNGMTFPEFDKYDREFHELCFEFASRTNMWRMLATYYPHYARFRLLDSEHPQSVRLTYMEHCGIYDALKTKDRDKCALAAYRHILDDYAKYKSEIGTKFPEFFNS